MLTKQEIFDKCAKHLLTQMAKSAKEGSKICLYRGPHGRKCAAGIFIPDELYDRGMEGGSCMSLPVSTATGFSSDQSVFLRELQYIHDDFDPEDWYIELQSFAREHNLSTAVIDEMKK